MPLIVNVKQCLKEVKGNSDIRRLQLVKTKIQKEYSESSKAIKKDVSSNYEQFISTAKEISHLEGEMYQLSHMLSEQKSLIDQMMVMSFTTPTSNRNRNLSEADASSKPKTLQTLFEKIEGISHLIDSWTDRRLVFESDLVELNADTFQTLRNVHGFLLNDALILTSFIPHSMGTTRYKIDSFFQLDNLAAVNVKDTEELVNAFKLLVFPENRYFSCDSLQKKREWIDAIEMAKRRMLQEGSLVRQATIRMKRMSVSSTSASVTTPYRSTPNASALAFPSSGGRMSEEDKCGDNEWLRDLPDELDVCIAQRDFETAVELLFEGRDYLMQSEDSALARQVRERLTHKQRCLVHVLAKELKSVGSVQGGPKAARKAITLLIRLGKSSQACDLYLKSRSMMMKQAVKELRIAEDPLSYMRLLNRIVFATLLDVSREFNRLFAQNAGCCSVLLFWASGEIKTLVGLVLRHIFEPGPSLSVLGQCVASIFDRCNQLSDLGLDLTFEVDKLMTPAVERAIDVNCRNSIDAAKLRIADEKWKPYNLQSESNLNRFMEEMNDLGLNLDAFVCESDGSKERCRLWIGGSICQLARTAVSLATDLPPMRLSHLFAKCDNYLLQLYNLLLQHLTDGLSAQFPQYDQVAEKSAIFIIRQVLPECESAYTSAAGFEKDTWFPLSDLLKTKFPSLVKFSNVQLSFEEICNV